MSRSSIGNTRAAAPEAVGGDVKLGTFNVLNYFSTTGEDFDQRGTCSYFNDRDGNPSRSTPAPTTGRAVRPTRPTWRGSRPRSSSAINTLDADVVSLEEIENSAAVGLTTVTTRLRTLTDALNEAAGEQRWAFVPVAG